MEYFSFQINQTVSVNLIEPITIPNGESNLSHLSFADDAVLLGIWSGNNVLNMARLLRCFHMVSGLKVNLSKCSLYGINVEESELITMASRLHCKAGKFPYSYLGLRVGENMSMVNSWRLVVDILNPVFLN
ncbi:uncharacterized protein LOC143563977 [Bidens hawaiensis]|uniref:uncharacterized protein LOC143563977 n=1 Tax=Bidens hawaiensis TaxID=980011 RepID=UPI00404A24B3